MKKFCGEDKKNKDKGSKSPLSTELGEVWQKYMKSFERAQKDNGKDRQRKNIDEILQILYRLTIQKT